MTMPITVSNYLKTHRTPYELIKHPRAPTSRANANEAHVPADHVAKAVILRDALGYLMAVVPADHWLKLKVLRDTLDRALILSDERDMANLFCDCARGAVPPLGPAYGLDTMVDDELLSLADVYFEAGDHELMVHTDGASFRELLRGVRHGHISHA